MTTVLVIGRRRKGRSIGQTIEEVGRQLEAAGWTVETALVERKRDIRRRARDAVKGQADVVVGVGGDGVVLQLVQELARTDVALGIVPEGTGNLLAGNLGIPHHVDRAVEVLLAGGRRRIDLGQVRVGGVRWMFTVACGIGFDAEVMQATSKGQKLRWGKLAYLANVIKKSGRLRNVRHEITIDGVSASMEATQVFVANFGRLGMGMEPRLPIKADDGLLDVMVVSASGPVPGLLAGWEAIRQARRGKSGPGNVFRAHARKVKIKTDPGRMVEIDGTVVGVTPVKTSIHPAALTVIVPKP